MWGRGAEAAHLETPIVPQLQVALLVLRARQGGSHRPSAPACESWLHRFPAAVNELTLTLGSLKVFHFPCLLGVCRVALEASGILAFISRCAGGDCLATERCSAEGWGCGGVGTLAWFSGVVPLTSGDLFLPGALHSCVLSTAPLLRSWRLSLFKRILTLFPSGYCKRGCAFFISWYFSFPFVGEMAEQVPFLWILQGLSFPICKFVGSAELSEGIRKAHRNCGS